MKETKLELNQIIYEEDSNINTSIDNDSRELNLEQPKLHLPEVEDINLTQNNYYQIMTNLKFKEYNSNLADRLFQIITCN